MAALQCELCGGKLVGKPGGVFECDSCGMEYSTEWAKAKIQEIKGTVKIEGTVQVAGTVKVEGGVNIDSLLKRGRIALDGKEWEQAKKYFDEAMNLNVDCADACLGFFLSEEKCSNIEALVKKHSQVNYNCSQVNYDYSYSQFDEARIVVMPKDSIADESCIMSEWKVNVGDTVNVGDILFFYETDKAEMEYVSTVTGILVEKFYEKGDEVPCLAPVAWFLPITSEVNNSMDNDMNRVLDHVEYMTKQYSIDKYLTVNQISSYYPIKEIFRYDRDVASIKSKLEIENAFWTKNKAVAHILSIDIEGRLHQAKEEILDNLRQQHEELIDKRTKEYKNDIQIADQRVVEAYRAVLEKKQAEEEAKQKQLEDKMRKDAELARLETERKAKRATDLNTEKFTLSTELSNLKGLFSGKRRKEIESRLAEIERELKGL